MKMNEQPFLIFTAINSLQVGKYSDPATARRGETLYEFVPRSVIGHVKVIALIGRL